MNSNCSIWLGNILLTKSVMMKLKGLNEHNKPVFDAMMEGGSFFDEGYLDPMERFLTSGR